MQYLIPQGRRQTLHLFTTATHTETMTEPIILCSITEDQYANIVHKYAMLCGDSDGDIDGAINHVDDPHFLLRSDAGCMTVLTHTNNADAWASYAIDGLDHDGECANVLRTMAYWAFYMDIVKRFTYFDKRRKLRESQQKN